jgi:sugar diacid utilization regulator
VATQAVETVEQGDVVRAERARILSTLLDDLDSLVDAAVEAIRAEIPAYAARDEIFSDVKEQVAAHYRTKLTAFLEERTVTLEEVAFIRGAATRRARAGLALEDYIAAYRVGEKVLWNAVVSAAGRSPQGQEAALTLAAPLMRYVDFVTTHAARAYVEFQQFAVADADRERRDLLEQLLSGEWPAHPELREAAERHGVGPDTPLVAIVAVATSGESDAPHTVSGALSRAAGRKAQPLVVVRRDEIVALAALSSHADARALSDRVAAAHERLDAEGIPFAVAVSTVADGPGELPRVYAEARQAVARIAEKGGVVALPSLSAFEYLTSRTDDTVGRLVDPRVRQILAEDRARGCVLAITVRTFAEADLSLRVTAERLHIHPNTAQYRLRRLEERTGRNPRRFRDLVELLVAIALDEQAASV